MTHKFEVPIRGRGRGRQQAITVVSLFKIHVSSRILDTGTCVLAFHAQLIQRNQKSSKRDACRSSAKLNVPP
jgi:hypothetical protein